MLLGSHTNVATVNEIFKEDAPEHARHNHSAPFEPLDPAGDPVAYLAHLIDEQPIGIRRLGFKLFYAHARGEHWFPLWQWLNANRIPIVHLTRRNALDQLMSAELSAQTKVWQLRNEEDRPATQPVTLDPSSVMRWLEWSDTAGPQRLLELEACPKHEVVYEDLCANTNGELDRIQDFLGIENAPLSASSIIQRTKPKRIAIANYEDLRDVVANEAASGNAAAHWLEYFDE